MHCAWAGAAVPAGRERAQLQDIDASLEEQHFRCGVTLREVSQGEVAPAGAQRRTCAQARVLLMALGSRHTFLLIALGSRHTFRTHSGTGIHVRFPPSSHRTIWTSRRLRSCAPTPCRKLWLRCGPLPWVAVAPPRAALWTSRGGCPAALLAAAQARAVVACSANGQAWAAAAAAAAGQQHPAVAQLLARAVAAAVEEPAPAAQGTTRAAATGGSLATAMAGSRPGWPLCTLA